MPTLPPLHQDLTLVSPLPDLVARAEGHGFRLVAP